MDPILIRSTVGSLVGSGADGSVFDPYSFPESAAPSPSREAPPAAETPAEPVPWDARVHSTPSTPPAPCVRQLDWDWVLGIRTNPDFVSGHCREAFIDGLMRHVLHLSESVRGRRTPLTVAPALASTPEGVEAACRRGFRCWAGLASAEIQAVLDWVASVERDERAVAIEAHAALDGVQHVADHYLLRADALPPRARAAAIAQVRRRHAWMQQKVATDFEEKIRTLRRSFPRMHSDELLGRVDACRAELQRAIGAQGDTIGPVECDQLQHMMDSETDRFAAALLDRLQAIASGTLI